MDGRWKAAKNVQQDISVWKCRKTERQRDWETDRAGEGNRQTDKKREESGQENKSASISSWRWCNEDNSREIDGCKDTTASDWKRPRSFTKFYQPLLSVCTLYPYYSYSTIILLLYNFNNGNKNNTASFQYSMYLEYFVISALEHNTCVLHGFRGKSRI